MDRTIVLSVLAAVFIAIGVGMLFPGGQRPQNGPGMLPWDVTQTPDGAIRAFGIDLGRTTLADAEQRFQDEAEASLFVKADGQYVAEAYFDELWLSGLKAKMVATLAGDQQALGEYYRHGVRIAKAPSGDAKITPASEDRRALAGMPIAALTYMPYSSLDDEVVRQRFGAPAETLTEDGEGIVHYLYPTHGLDIALSPNGKAVLQYVLPGEFARLRTPLSADEAQGAAQN